MSGLMMKYFVLKPAGNDLYAEASRLAMNTYANHISEADPDFACDIKQWTLRESGLQLKEYTRTVDKTEILQETPVDKTTKMQGMSYEAWRISYQSSEQAAKAAYNENKKLREAMIGLLRNGWPWESYDQNSRMLDLPEEMFGLPLAMIRARDALGNAEFSAAVLPPND